MCFLRITRYKLCGCPYGGKVYQPCDKVTNRPPQTPFKMCSPLTEDNIGQVEINYCPACLKILSDRIELRYQRQLDSVNRREAFHRSVIGARHAAAIFKEGKILLGLEKGVELLNLEGPGRFETRYDEVFETWWIASLEEVDENDVWHYVGEVP